MISNGGEPLSSYGFAYGKSTSPSIEDNKFEIGTEEDIQIFTGKLTGLETLTKYYIRAYATNPRDTSYGDELSFTTTDGLVKITTKSVENINGFNATIKGEIDENGLCTAVNLCGDEKGKEEGDCLGEIKERAWSSPIFVKVPKKPL